MVTSMIAEEQALKRRKKSNGTACNRCKSRKKRCDGDFITGTSCSGCDQVGVVCQFNDQANPAYVKKLQDKIADLEAQLLESKSNLNSTSTSPVTSTHDSSPSHPKSNNSLIECAAYLPLKNDDKTSIYVGYSGFSVANLIQMYLLENYEQTLEEKNSDDFEPPRSCDVDEIAEGIIKDDKLSKYYLENYISVTQNRYPFLEANYVLSLHNNRHLLFNSNESKTYRSMDKFVLIMVYAIGAHLKPEKCATKKFNSNHWSLYRYALKGDLQMIFQTVTLSNIHAILLLVIYKLRFPDGQTIWYLIGTAMRLCIDFGLHRRNLEFFVGNPYIYTLRTRTFWSAYALERAICNSFGRPFSISDRDIDIDLPLDIDESITDEDVIKTTFYQKYPQYNVENYPVNSPSFELQSPEEPRNQKTSMSMAIIYFKLRVIDSSIQNSIYRVDKVFETIPRDIIYLHQQKMKQWISELPSSLSKFEYDYCLYLFNKQIRNLIMPFINTLQLDDPLFIECIKASIMSCKLNRRIHDNTSSRHTLSFVSLQTLFLSGITIVYALLSGKISWDYEVSEGLRSCSSTLILLAERCPSCSEYRDIFENLVDQVIRTRDRNVSNFPQQSADLFGQDILLNKVNKNHYNDNMNTFNTISNLQYVDDNKEFDAIFNFSNVDELFNKLGGLNPRYSDLGLDI